MPTKTTDVLDKFFTSGQYKLEGKRDLIQVWLDDSILNFGSRYMRKSDDELMNAIAHRQDPEAFRELFNRHSHAAYGIAHGVTCDQAWADDAVQDAMIVVWRQARKYRQGGNARGWILGITARKAAEIVRGGRRRQKREDRRRVMQNDKEEAAGAQTAEAQELLAIMRSAINQLADEDRQLVVCSYVAGLTQTEISEALGIPQSSVSRKIQDALDRLRSALIKSGFSTAAVAISGESISHAVLNGPPCPPYLANKVMSFTKVAWSGLSSRRPPILPYKSKAMFVAVAGTITATLIGSYYLVMKQRTEPGPVTPAKVPAHEPERYHVRWDFQTGPNPKLHLLQGAWRWQSMNGRGGMFVESGLAACFPLPVELHNRPLKIMFEINAARRRGEGGTTVRWTEGDTIANFEEAGLKYTANSNTFQVTHYVWDEYEAAFTRDELVHVSKYSRKYSGNSLLAIIQNFTVLSINVEEIDVAQLPEICHNIEERLKARNISFKHGSDSGIKYVTNDTVEKTR